MEMDRVDVAAPPKRRRGLGVVAGVFISGLVIGMVAAGFGVAGAQTSTPTPDPSVPATAPMDGGGFRGHHGPGGPGFGGGIHGEFVTPAPDGGYQTVATQRGTVTSVSASSITVKSEDGYSRTYGVDDDTMVSAGNNGIADVKTGDEVNVIAIVNGSSAHAVRIMDGTQARRIDGTWRPPHPEPPQDSASPAPSAS